MPTGIAPIGSPFGVGTPVDATTPPTGKAPAAVYLDPKTGDMVIDPATRQHGGMPGVRQRFLLLVLTLKGSASSARELGIDLPVKMDETFETAARQSVRAGARQMTDVEKVARIDGIDVRRLASGRAYVGISFTDLTTGLGDSVGATV